MRGDGDVENTPFFSIHLVFIGLYSNNITV